MCFPNTQTHTLIHTLTHTCTHAILSSLQFSGRIFFTACLRCKQWILVYPSEKIEQFCHAVECPNTVTSSLNFELSN